MPIHSSGAPVLVRRKEGAWKDAGHGCRPARWPGVKGTPGRADMDGFSLGNANYEVPGAEESLCLFLSADEGKLDQARRRPGTVSGRRPAAYGRGWRPRGKAMHTVLWPRCPRAPPGPLRPDAGSPLCPAVSAWDASQALSGIKSQRLAESCGAIPGALPSRGVDSAFMVRRATPECMESRPVLRAYSGSHRHAWKPRSPPQAGARLSLRTPSLEVPSDVQRLQRRVEQPGRLRALWCAMTLGKPLPCAWGARPVRSCLLGWFLGCVAPHLLHAPTTLGGNRAADHTWGDVASHVRCRDAQEAEGGRSGVEPSWSGDASPATGTPARCRPPGPPHRWRCGAARGGRAVRGAIDAVDEPHHLPA